jgi:hypothetical protein
LISKADLFPSAIISWDMTQISYHVRLPVHVCGDCAWTLFNGK